MKKKCMHPKTASFNSIILNRKHSICMALHTNKQKRASEIETEKERALWHSINKTKRNYFMTGNFR